MQLVKALNILTFTWFYLKQVYSFDKYRYKNRETLYKSGKTIVLLKQRKQLWCNFD